MTDAPELKDSASHGCGYGRPPKHAQFKKGNRANPFGRGASKRCDFTAAVNETLAAKVEIREGGRKRRVTRSEANILSLFDKAKRGDLAAANRLLDLHGASAKTGGGPTVIEVFNLPPDEDDERPRVVGKDDDARAAAPADQEPIPPPGKAKQDDP